MVKKKSIKNKKSRKAKIYPVEVEMMMKKALNMHKLSMFQQAEQIYKSVLTTYPLHPQANHLYGLILYNNKNYSHAINFLKKAIQAEPKNAEYLNNLGVVYKDSGNLEEAEKVIRLSIKVNKNYFSAYNSFGSILMLKHEYKEAASYFKRAIKYSPGYIDAIYNLAQSYISGSNYKKAEEQLLDLKKQSPNNAEVNRLLYRCYMESNKHDSAVNLIQTELGKSPDDSLLIYKLAQLYEKKSDLYKADTLIKKACYLDKGNAKFDWLQAVIYRRLGKIDEAIKILSNIGVPTGDNILDQNIYFELGRVFDKNGDYDFAFTNYKLANNVQSDSLDSGLVKKEHFLAHIDNVSNNLSDEWVSGWKLCENIKDDNLVFMVAFPRSGTTLLDQLLDGHSKIQVMEEQPILGNIISQIVAKEKDYPACIDRLDCKAIKKYRKYYFKEAEKYITLNQGATLVDKLPLNIIEIQLIHRLFPSSKIILSLRHPYDVCLSNFMQHFELNNAMANFLTLENTALTYRKTMELWLKYTNVLHIKYHSVRYEDLIDDTEVQARVLFEFLGFEWEEAALNHVQHAKTRNINTPSYQQVTQPIYSSSRYRWKNYKPYLSDFRSTLKELVKTFGYSAD